MSPDTAVDGLRILPTQHSASQVLQRVESLARARGLTVFAQIDFSGDAEGKTWVAYNDAEYLRARHGFGSVTGTEAVC
jgi:hypothetical protein